MDFGVVSHVRSAHENGAKALLSVGGWSYNDVPLENVFMEATADDKLQKLAGSILAMCGEYGFDGVDMDWEHPGWTVTVPGGMRP